jgi:hypothetical protein
LRELIFFIIRIHSKNLVSGRGSQYFNNFNQLVNSTLTREYGLSKHEFSNYTTYRPYINRSCIVRVSKDKLGSTIISRANVRHVRFSRDELFGTTEIA